MEPLAGFKRKVGNVWILLSPQGIFKPKILPEFPLSIATTPSGPYRDSFTKDDLLLYRYRGTDPTHRDNVGMRNAMLAQVPLVYFHGVVEGKYLAVWPVFIVGDSPESLAFTVAADNLMYIRPAGETAVELDAALGDRKVIRKYITYEVKQRLHQRGFREIVLRAYREQCACCHLRHEQLLDAAHIIPDSDPEGEPEVKNGIALCKLHHAAFDSQFLAITPDFTIEIREDILNEEDGPMLLHGLKGLHAAKILLPNSPDRRPDRVLLEKRYSEFKASF
jgi:putative restriction endonuclease